MWGGRGVEPLAVGLVEGLSEPRAYPHDPSVGRTVSTIQTHISYLFITESRVYKLRKAVDLGFLDFGSRRARNEDCLREVAFNRRLAPDVYLGLAPVRVQSGSTELGPVAQRLVDTELEHCVVMRRLPQGRDALSLLKRDAFTDRDVDAMAHVVAAFHREGGLGRPAPFSTREWVQAITGPMEDNLKPLTGVFEDERLSLLAETAREYVCVHSDRFERRRLDGRAVNGHGDLHLAHVWIESEDSDPLFIDCVEFSDRLRRIDAASDVAFLAMDLRYRGTGHLGERFLRRYAAESDDFHLYAVVDYFLSYRAAVRAKVAAIAAGERELPDEQRQAARESASQHLDLSIEALKSSGRGAVVAMAGTVGTGKSTAADVVVDALSSAAVIASDRVRKRLAGLSATQRSAAVGGGSIYTDAYTGRVYAGLLERAQAIVTSGRVAVLDATFARRAHRDATRDFARVRGLPFLLVETRCPKDVALRRLAERERAGRDPSDAGPALHAADAARFDPITGPGQRGHLVVDTDLPSWRLDLKRRLQAWQTGH